MVNPYESPLVEPEEAGERPRLPWRGVRLLFCVLNFAVAALFTVDIVWSVMSRMEKSPGVAVLIGLLLASPFVVYAALELVAVFLPIVEWILGYANLLCAILLGLVTLANTAGASLHPQGGWTFITIVLPILVAVLAYLITCGRVRVKYSRQKEVRVEVTSEEL